MFLCGWGFRLLVASFAEASYRAWNLVRLIFLPRGNCSRRDKRVIDFGCRLRDGNFCLSVLKTLRLSRLVHLLLLFLLCFICCRSTSWRILSFLICLRGRFSLSLFRRCSCLGCWRLSLFGRSISIFRRILGILFGRGWGCCWDGRCRVSLCSTLSLGRLSWREFHRSSCCRDPGRRGCSWDWFTSRGWGWRYRNGCPVAFWFPIEEWRDLPLWWLSYRFLCQASTHDNTWKSKPIAIQLILYDLYTSRNDS